jgi:hypothetical protein
MTSADNKHGLTVGILTVLGIVIVIMIARWFLSFLLNHWMLASAGAVAVVFLFFYLVVSTQKSYSRLWCRMGRSYGTRFHLPLADRGLPSFGCVQGRLWATYSKSESKPGRTGVSVPHEHRPTRASACLKFSTEFGSFPQAEYVTDDLY